MVWTPKNVRIWIPPDAWIPIRVPIFKRLLPQIGSPRGAQLYLTMYRRAYFAEHHEFRATLKQLARWSHLSEPTTAQCLAELKRRQFVRVVDTGVKRSRSKKPRYFVPAADFLLKEGEWVPVPVTLVKDYLKKYPGAALLPVILYHQHLGWNNLCWARPETLARELNWTEHRVYDSLLMMSSAHRWKRRFPRLPLPLNRTYDETKTKRYFNVKDVVFRKKPKGYSTLELTPEFLHRFGIPRQIGFQSRKHQSSRIRKSKSQTRDKRPNLSHASHKKSGAIF